MDAGSTRFERLILKKLRESLEKSHKYLASGFAQDYAQYRQHVGYHKALLDIEAECVAVAEALDKEDRR
jgi:hypothetical protein